MHERWYTGGMALPGGWIAWIDDDAADHAGAFVNWTCGCSGTIEWSRAQPGRCAFEVCIGEVTIKGALHYRAQFSRDAGLQAAAEVAEAIHQHHH